MAACAAGCVMRRYPGPADPWPPERTSRWARPSSFLPGATGPAYRGPAPTWSGLLARTSLQAIRNVAGGRVVMPPLPRRAAQWRMTAGHGPEARGSGRLPERGDGDRLKWSSPPAEDVRPTAVDAGGSGRGSGDLARRALMQLPMGRAHRDEGGCQPGQEERPGLRADMDAVLAAHGHSIDSRRELTGWAEHRVKVEKTHLAGMAVACRREQLVDRVIRAGSSSGHRPPSRRS